MDEARERIVSRLRPLLALFLSLALGAWIGDSAAANKYARITGNWSAAGTWSSNSDCATAAATTVPTNADDVFICNNAITVTVDVVGATAGSLTMIGGAATTSVTLGAAGNLTVTTAGGRLGDVTINAPTSNGVTKQIAVSTRTMTVLGNVTVNGGTTGGTNATRTSQITITSGTVTIGTVGTPKTLLIVADSSVAAHASIAQVTVAPVGGVGLLTVNGDVTLRSGGTATHDALLSVAGAANLGPPQQGIVITGDLTIGEDPNPSIVPTPTSVAGSATVSMTGAAGGRISVGGDVLNRDTLSIAAGIFTASSTAASFTTGNNSAIAGSKISSTTVTTGSLAIAGTVDVTGGQINSSSATLSVTTGSIAIGTVGTPRDLSITAGTIATSNAAVTVTTGLIDVTGDVSLQGFAANRTAVLTTSNAPAGADGIKIGGDLTVASATAGTATVSTAAANAKITVAGNVTNGDRITIATGIFNATGAAKIFTTKSDSISPITSVTSGTITVAGEAKVLGGAGTTTNASMTVTTGTLSIGGNVTVTGGSASASSTATMSVTSGTLTITGDVSVNGGTAATSTAALTMSGAGILSIDGDATVTGGAATSTSSSASITGTTGALTIKGKATVTGGAAATSNATLSVTNTTGTLTIGASCAAPVCLDIAGGTGTTSNALATVNTGSLNVTGNTKITGRVGATGGTATLSATAPFSAPGTGITLTGNLDIITTALGLVSSGVVDVAGGAGGTIEVTGNVNNGGTVTISDGTFKVTGASSTYTNSSAAVVAVTNISTGTLNISGDTAALNNASGETMTVSSTGNITVGNTTTKTGTLTNAGTINLQVANSTLNSNGNFTNSGTITNSAATLINLRGATSTINGTFTASTSTVTMDGSTAQPAQTLSGSALTFRNLTINSGNTVTVNNNTTVTTGALTVNSNAVLAPAAAVVISGTGSITGAGTAQVTRITGTPDFANQYTMTTKTLTNLTVQYIGTATQSVTTTVGAYGSGTGGGLMISNNSTSAPVTAAASFVVNGTLSIDGTNSILDPAAGVVVSGTGSLIGTPGNGGTVRVRTTGANAFSTQYTQTTNTLTDLTVEYIGAAAQVLSAVAYGGLKINNSSGASLTADTTAGGLLTLESGVVTTGASTLISSTLDCPASVSRNSGWVAGNLRLHAPGSGSPTCTWDIGDASAYRPVSVAFTTLSSAGDVTVTISQAAGNSPNIATSTFDPLFTVNRYWTLTNASTAFSSAAVTFNFIAGDVLAGADTSVLVVGRFSGAWSYLSTNPSGTSAQANGLATGTLAGEFAIGEQSLTLYSHWRMDQNLWNGTANEVVDSGTGANHGTASTCAFVGCAGSGSAPSKPTTSSVSPTLGTGGVTGTCSYGAFSRANKDFVSLPIGYPKLLSAAGGFTITAWIRTTDNTQSGQRILVDDENDVNGGWGVTLGDGGTGRVRFFYRQASPYTLDSTTYVIPNNTWVLATVSVSLAAGANASRATIRIYNTSGTLLNTPATDTSAFTWTAGSDAAGRPSIGGETNNLNQGTSSFGFAGDIDEVRVYRQALTATQIDRFKLDTRACSTFNHVRFEHDGIGLTCQPETIVVKACFDASCSQLFNGIATATLLPTGWVGGDSVAITGSLTAQLKKTTAGTYTLGTTGVTTPTPTTAARCFLSGSEFAGSCNIDFKDTGFVFDTFNVTACKPLANVGIRAVRLDQQSQTCAPAWQGSRSLKMWSTYSNPGSGTQQVTVNSTLLPTSSPGANNMTLTFDANAQALLTVTYPDAGQMQLNTSFAGSGAESGVSLTGSQTFVSVPVGLAVVPSGGACVAGDATCAVYKKAGESFSHTVQAACWTADGDTDFTDNPPTPNFQLANIPLTSTLVAPGGGTNATLGAATATISSGGTVNVSQTVSEVGVFRITATPTAASYFGQTVLGSTSVNIGRFTPDHFDVSYNTPAFAAACTPVSPFTYVGQSFSYSTPPVLTVTARNVGGTTTTNYKGTFFKLTSGSLSGKTYTAASGTLDTSLIGSPDPAIVDNSDGTAALTFNSGTGIAFTRSAPVAPFNAEISLSINAVDGDSIAYASNPARFGTASAGNGIGFSGGKEMRFGRLRVLPAAGSSVIALKMDLRTEYWTGTGFVQNAADSCTTLDRANIALINYTTPLAACQTMVNKAPLANPIAFALGAATLRLSPSGAGNQGSVTLAPQLGSASGNYCSASPGSESAATSAGRSYLQGAWTGGSYDQNPSARAGFGVFGAQPRNFIFFRENH